MYGDPVGEGTEFGNGEVMGVCFAGAEGTVDGAFAGVREGVTIGASFHPPLSRLGGGGGAARDPFVWRGTAAAAWARRCGGCVNEVPVGGYAELVSAGAYVAGVGAGGAYVGAGAEA